MNRRRCRLMILVLCPLALLGCKTESEFDRLKKNYTIPGAGVVDEYSAQEEYKWRHGEYSNEGSSHVTEVLERRERSQQHYGN